MVSVIILLLVKKNSDNANKSPLSSLFTDLKLPLLGAFQPEADTEGF